MLGKRESLVNVAFHKEVLNGQAANYVPHFYGLGNDFICNYSFDSYQDALTELGLLLKIYSEPTKKPSATVKDSKWKLMESVNKAGLKKKEILFLIQVLDDNGTLEPIKYEFIYCVYVIGELEIFKADLTPEEVPLDDERAIFRNIIKHMKPVGDL